MSDKSTREAQDAAVKTWNRFNVLRPNIVDYVKVRLAVMFVTCNADALLI
jgi:hypothetical protein